LTNIIEHNRRRIVDEQIIGRGRDGGIGTTTAVVVVSETKGGSGVGDDGGDGKNEFTFDSDRASVRNNSTRKDTIRARKKKRGARRKRASPSWT
jgi:hypothetical protein